MVNCVLNVVWFLTVFFFFFSPFHVLVSFVLIFYLLLPFLLFLVLFYFVLFSFLFILAFTRFYVRMFAVNEFKIQKNTHTQNGHIGDLFYNNVKFCELSRKKTKPISKYINMIAGKRWCFIKHHSYVIAGSSLS